MNNSEKWLLALESSTPYGGVALYRGETCEGVKLLDQGLRHGRELLPAAHDLLEGHGLRAADLSAVAVSIGPGSYTGLRVGVMAAKALSYATGCRLLAVSSLAAAAVSVLLEGRVSNGHRIMVLQDARRDEVYAGFYESGDGTLTQVAPDRAVTPEEIASILGHMRQSPSAIHLAGSALATYPELLASADTPGVVLHSSVTVSPAAVAWLGYRKFLQEDFADPFGLQPLYLRRDSGHDWTRDRLIAGT